MKEGAGLGSSLVNLSAKASAANVDQIVFFEQAIRSLVGKQSNWTKQREEMREGVVEWHFVKLREAYDAMLLARDPKIFVEIHGHEAQKSFGRFVWDIFRAIHEMDGHQRFQLVQTMLGDYKKLSLNPAGVFKKVPSVALGKMAAGAAKKANALCS